MNFLVPKFYKAWSWIAGLTGLAAPEILQIIADNTSILWFDDATKSAIRIACLIAVVLLRPINQSNVG
jgi:hypothetical protein